MVQNIKRAQLLGLAKSRSKNNHNILHNAIICIQLPFTLWTARNYGQRLDLHQI